MLPGGKLFLDKNSNTFPGAAERKGIWARTMCYPDAMLPGRVVALVSSRPGNTSSG